MTSLADVYEDNVGEVDSVRRLYAGTGLFVAGVFLTLVAIVVAATNVLGGFGFDIHDARHLAGVLGGLGVPAVLMGVFTVLPASQRVRGAAAIGSSVCVLGVALFWHAYPTYWSGSSASTDLTLLVAFVYAFGVFTALWTLFTAIVNFKTRNDPGGTVELHVTQDGETRIVEVDAETAEAVQNGERVSPADLGSGIGMLGGQPDGDVETQTANPQTANPQTATAGSASNDTTTSERSRSTTATSDTTKHRGSTASGRSADSGGGSTASGRSADSGGGSTASGRSTGRDRGSLGGGTPASDGGSTTDDLSSPADTYPGGGHDAEVIDAGDPDPEPTSMADRYCGNCEHFSYVQTSQGIQPHCGYHDERMDDMEACDSWTSNN